MGADNTPTYLYYESTTPVTNFKGVNFVYSLAKPFNQQQVEEEETSEVPESVLSEDMQENIESFLTEIEVDETADAADAASDAGDGGGDGGD